VGASFELSGAAQPVTGVFDFERVHGHALSILFGYTVIEAKLFGEGRVTNRDSIGCHEYRERQLDELLVLVDGVQGAADVVGDVSRTAGLDPIRKLQDGGFEGELVFVDLEKKGREQV